MKTSKGSVSLESHQNRIRLRWQHEGKRYCLSPGLTSNPVNQKAAQNLANQIELDIVSGNFDPTLIKYGKSPTKKIFRGKPQTLLVVWDAWVSTLGLSPRTLNGHYKSIRRHIEKQNPKLTHVAWYDTLDTLSPRIFNNYLSYLKKCLDWAIEQQLIDHNPYAKVKSRKVVKQAIQPFTTDEISRIIQAFRSDTFCPKSSAYKHSHYADYIEFLFLTGCRPSEAIGLQRKHVNFERDEILICSVLARSDTGLTNGSSRVRKETKTGNVRHLSMTTRLQQMLKARCQNLEPEALIFPSYTGKPIDDRMFRRRQWKPILKGLGIEYRRPYITRHTLASTAIEQGIPLTSVAYLLGHTDTTMVMQTYGHIVHRPSLPNIEL